MKQRLRWRARGRDRRPTVRIEHGQLMAGGVRAAYDPADHTTVLPAYVRLIRMARRLRADDDLHFRRNDLQVVTDHWAQCMMDQLADPTAHAA